MLYLDRCRLDLDPSADRLGGLYAELSVLLRSKGNPNFGLIALMNEYGAEDVKWVLSVLSEDLGVRFPE